MYPLTSRTNKQTNNILFIFMNKLPTVHPPYDTPHDTPHDTPYDTPHDTA
jgi:hypothetical protein